MLAAAIMITATGCISKSLDLASDSPDRAWRPEGSTTSSSDFSVPADPAVAKLERGVDSQKVYKLTELIDLAQSKNPATRIAWEQARQAALAVGMSEAAYLPTISANVIGGYQNFVTPLPDLSGGTTDVTTTASGFAPNVALEWLVFDFGQRKSLREAAKHNLHAANVSFNGAHQAVIYNVTRSYYLYGAAQSNVKIAEQALANSKRIRDAAQSRYANGIGTTIAVAQSKQLEAEAKYRLVQAQDTLRDRYQDVLAAVGISSLSRIRIASSANRRLPSAQSFPTEQVIEAALSRRPDVIASYAELKASQANEMAAKARFMPKVYLGAIAAMGDGTIQSGNLPGLAGQGTTSGVFVGLTVPLYSGGIREGTRRQAQSAVAAAEASFEKTRNTAVQEIVIASDTLRSALQAYASASELVRAAKVTYDAAFDAYKNGVGTVTDAIEAETGLLDARQAQADAHASALVAASTLAFSLGAMTSRTSAALLFSN